jgi:hypothetical protein
MSEKIIEIIVSPTGEAKIETKGFAGSSCRDASKFLEEALGQRASEQTTAEFHSQQANQHSAQENA